MSLHHFTVDVEEYFHVSAFERCVDRCSWDARESRVEASVMRLLDLLERRGDRGTFFVLGWVAERRPELVRAIADAGHEIASHGSDHRRVTTQTPEEFRASVRESKDLLEQISGTEVLGFRAPSFSIVPGCEWALDVLIEEGYRYDSSLFPIQRRGYGFPGAPREPYWLERPSGRLAEIPPATLRFGGVNLPAAGGGYFRVFPYPFTRAALLDFQRRGIPATFYIHPWEIDPEQPRFRVHWLTRARHYGGLEKTASRLELLLDEFRFTTITRTLACL